MIKKLWFAQMLMISVFAPAQKLDMTRFKGMSARSIGPAGMSGRVTAIDVVLSDPTIIYAGTASGGLWKSTSAGIHWEPIFDDQPVASIGAVAINQTVPDVIWVGTGEGNPRNSQNSGNGIYKSLDGGRSWKHLGLEMSRNIHRILLHPRNPDIAYAAVIGTAWADTKERGVYKTSDGGASWEKILYLNQRTGIGELVMDPINPDKLIAATWEYRRWPWFFKSGGPGSGLHVTYDGGQTWTQRGPEDGLPKGELGRIGIAIARSRPNVIYALVESKKNALYRSDDGGYKWKKVADKNIGNRPFYYGEIYVDPINENRVYNIYSRVSVSNDGGKTFEQLAPFNIHPDHHAFWIHPTDPNFLIDGNDGGIALSRDRGENWRFVENLPLAQFYHINVDMEIPYNVYGGMQDNGSWRGPSRVWRRGGIRNSYWEELAFGDGFDVVPDRSEPQRYGYAMSQGGNLRRYDLKTGGNKLIKPIHPDGVFLRFNWNAGIAADPFQDKTLYYGSQFLHKSTDRGNSWQIISPDLTTNDPEKQKQLESGGLTYDTTQAENYTTILAIEPGPMEEGLIWVGTDDGNLQLTRDGGANWEKIDVEGLPDGSWICQIRASSYNAGEAFVIADNHRTNDWAPYVFHTDNYGATWKSLVSADQVPAFVYALAQDPVAPNLLFLGTEVGLYLSIDTGKTWTKWTHGFPTVPTMDLVIHPRAHDLVIGTFGRSAYVLDDIRPLRTLAQKGLDILDAPLQIFPVPDTYQATYRQASGTRFAGEAEHQGQNRERGAQITYVYNPPKEDVEKNKEEKDKGKIKVEILEGDTVIRTTTFKAKPGVNRSSLPLIRRGVRRVSQPKPKKPDAPEPGGMQLLPGSYQVRLSKGEDSVTAPFVVHPDPRIEVSTQDRQEWQRLQEKALDLQQRLLAQTDRLRDARATLKRITGRLSKRKDDEAKKIKEDAKKIKKRIDQLIETVNQKEAQGILRDPSKLGRVVGQPRGYLRSLGTPGATDKLVVTQAEDALKPFEDLVEAFFKNDWQGFRDQVEKANLSLFD